MWTKEHRRIYRREGNGYPSDLKDAEWARLEPLIPEASPGGRPRKIDMRAAMNAILYLLRTGCPCRYLSRHSFPPRSTVYNIFRKFQRDGVWEGIWAELHMALRGAARPRGEPLDGAGLVLNKIRRRFPWLELIWADGGYNAWQVDAAVAKVPLLGMESSSGATT
jgi:transposase